MNKLMVWWGVVWSGIILSGQTPAYFRAHDRQVKKRIAHEQRMKQYYAQLRRHSDSEVLRKQPKRNIRKTWAAKQLKLL